MTADTPDNRDRLAALLHENGIDCPVLRHSPSWHRESADRLLAAGVTFAPPPDVLRAALGSVGWWPDLDPADYDHLAAQLRAALAATPPPAPAEAPLNVERRNQLIVAMAAILRDYAEIGSTDRATIAVRLADAALAQQAEPRLEPEP